MHDGVYKKLLYKKDLKRVKSCRQNIIDHLEDVLSQGILYCGMIQYVEKISLFSSGDT